MRYYEKYRESDAAPLPNFRNYEKITIKRSKIIDLQSRKLEYPDEL